MSESKHASSGTFTVLQITDAHIKREPEGELLGMNTRDSFEAVLGLAAHDFPTDVDLVIASGDLAQDGSVEAYQYFKKRIDSLGVPVAWFPGNHDDRKNMTSVVGSGDEMQKVRHLGNWQFVFLDSLVTGKVHGHLAAKEVTKRHLTGGILDKNETLVIKISYILHPYFDQRLWFAYAMLQTKVKPIRQK